MFDALERQFQKDKYERPDLINELYQGTMKDYVKCLKVRRRSTLGEGRRGEGREREGGEGGGEGEEGKTRERCQSNGSFFDPALLSPVSL